ncbi:MAG TPA: hypothetical protein VMW52_12345 [Phycisphaerae bacterium]|nr:hypothetical protein [Phycisphaerae bacterium]
MRTISRILFTMIRAEAIAAAFVESGLCVPVTVAAYVSSLLIMAKAIALWSPSWMLIGVAAFASMSAVLSVGLAKSRAERAEQEARRKAIHRNRTRGYTRTRCALEYKIGTEPKGKNE